MKFSILIIVCFVLSSAQPILSARVFTETTWHRNIGVRNYVSYSSVSLAKYNIPQNTIQSTWLFRAEKNHEKCESRTVIIYLQHGSYPVISPLNETFPDDFYLARTDLNEYKLEATNETKFAIIDKPLPGHWFTGAILGDYVDDSIKQQGIGLDCHYQMSVTHIVMAYDDVETLLTGTPNKLNAQDGMEYLFQFHTSKSTWGYSVSISGCSYHGLNSTSDHPCPLLLAFRGQGLPDWAIGSSLLNCSSPSGNSCSLDVPSPPTNAWNFMTFRSLQPADGDGTVEFNVTIQLNECVASTADEQAEVDSQIGELSNNATSALNFTSGASSVYADEVMDTDSSIIRMPNDTKANTTATALQIADSETTITTETDDDRNVTCIKIEELGRFEQPSLAFDVQWEARMGLMYLENQILLGDDELVVMPFTIQSLLDSGATLAYKLAFVEKYMNDSSQAVVVESCIQRLGIPMSQAGVHCDPALHQQLNTSHANTSQLYFPYPEAGPWFITLMAKCYANSDTGVSGSREPCRQPMIVVAFEVSNKACGAGCGDNGYCRHYYSGILHYTTCHCVANYRGFGCSDATVAQSDAEQLAAALLLTTSNLAFLPAIFLSIYRSFYVEALVYFYTMFFSTFYHACDGDRRSVYCLMPYGVLASCDFFGSILSVYVTLIAMARLVERRRTFVIVLGALGLVVGVTWNRHSLATFLVPAALAFTIMIASWGVRCHHRRQCYPPLRRWLFFLVPGILLAGAGLVIFAFFETQRNYWYTHSCWHACMAFCILLLLPPRHKLCPNTHAESSSMEEILRLFFTRTAPEEETYSSPKKEQTSKSNSKSNDAEDEDPKSLDLVKMSEQGMKNGRPSHYACANAALDTDEAVDRVGDKDVELVHRNAVAQSNGQVKRQSSSVSEITIG